LKRRIVNDQLNVYRQFSERGKDRVGNYVSLMQGDQPMINPRIYRYYRDRDRSRLRSPAAGQLASLESE
jgi:hypothetical protein